MVSFEIFVKAMLPSLSELKVLPSFCFTFKIPDDVADIYIGLINSYQIKKVEVRSLYSKLEIYQTPSLCLNPFKNRKSG